MAEVDDLADSAAFQATATPYLILDRQLRIRGANAAYESATAHPRSVLLGEQIFDVFPDNPADPTADGVARLTSSLECVLSRGTRHRMAVQRYDVRDRSKPNGFLYKVWAPVNSPIRDTGGKTVGVLHHVEDVTEFFSPSVALAATDLATTDAPQEAQRASLLHALQHEKDVSSQLRLEVETLREALETNRQIGVAVGLVMAMRGVSRENAFQRLVADSQKSHRKVRAVAGDLVQAHERAAAQRRRRS